MRIFDKNAMRGWVIGCLGGLMVVMGVGTGVGVEFNEGSLRLVESSSPSERAKFYGVVGKLSEEEKEAFLGQLKQGWTYHQGVMVRGATVMMGVAGGTGAWGNFLKSEEEWKKGAEELLGRIRTDWHKDPKKVGELTMGMGKVGAMRERMRRGAEGLEKSEMPRLWASCGVLAEIEGQMANARAAGSAPTVDLRETFGRAVGDFPELAKKVGALRAFLAEEKKWREVGIWNNGQRWAGGEQKRFAAILNEQRWVVGLEGVRLEEKLSAAAVGHSREMVALKYFAHESPVAKNKGFGERAKNAGYEGEASGECIFMGSRSPEAAYGGWWGSDGHRMILFMGGVNTLGVGTGGTESWTLNMGKKGW